jgi:hypothetical protein
VDRRRIYLIINKVVDNNIFVEDDDYAEQNANCNVCGAEVSDAISKKKIW